MQSDHCYKWARLLVAIVVAVFTFMGTPKAVLGQEALPRSKQPDGNAIVKLNGARAEVYKSIGDVELRVHIFEPDQHAGSDSKPAVVFFFGGGWRGGTPKQFEPHCQYLASRGLVGISAEYRVESRHGTSPFECVEDGKSAVRWVRQNAKRLGIDPGRIAAAGGSAGGHVAAATALVPGLDVGDEPKSISSQPNAMILFNPVYDNSPGGYGHERVKDRYLKISPIDNIRAGAPPAIVFLGSEDALIPVSTAKRFEERMLSVGSVCVTHIYAGQEHGFFNKGRGDDAYYHDTVVKMDRFLASLGWLKNGPKRSSLGRKLRISNKDPVQNESN